MDKAIDYKFLWLGCAILFAIFLVIEISANLRYLVIETGYTNSLLHRQMEGNKDA